MLRCDIVLQRWHIDEILREKCTKVDYLERSNNWIQPGKLDAFGRQIDLLHTIARGGIDRRQQRLQLLETLPIGVFLRSRLQNESQVSPQATLNRLIQRKVQNAVRSLALNQTAFEGVGCHLRTILARRVRKLCLGSRNRRVSPRSCRWCGRT